MMTASRTSASRAQTIYRCGLTYKQVPAPNAGQEGEHAGGPLVLDDVLELSVGHSEVSKMKHAHKEPCVSH